MAYRVEVSPTALAAAELAYFWMQERYPSRIFTIIGDDLVRVHTIRHSARDRMQADDLGEDASSL